MRDRKNRDGSGDCPIRLGLSAQAAVEVDHCAALRRERQREGVIGHGVDSIVYITQAGYLSWLSNVSAD